MANTDIPVKDLVAKVQRNEIALPEMQRRYVWTATRVRDLLDSLYREYPSGTILVWETDEAVTDKEMAVKATQAPTTTQKYLLLDGQQRITSLTAIITGEPIVVRNRKKPVEILFNLEHPVQIQEDEVVDVEDVEDVEDEEDKGVALDAEEDVIPDIDDDDEDEIIGQRNIQAELRYRTFVVASRALKNDMKWISVTDIFKKSDSVILKGLGINSDDEKWDKYSERLQKVRRIAEYSYRMQVLDKKLTYKEVTEIFVRVNSLGVKLRSSDLALAQITSRWKGFIEKMEEFAEEFKDDSDYIIETGLSVRMLVVIATKQCRFNSVGKLSLSKIHESWDLANQGLRYAINFLRSNLKIESLRYIFHHLSC